MSNILSTNPNEILENFQSAYYNQIGKRMQIGSEEYTLASAFTYVLSAYAALVNNSYKNQLVETASGEFLDNLAAKYNLKRTKETYSNPWFEGFFYFNSASNYFNRAFAVGELEITVGAHVYHNEQVITAATYHIPIRFVCDEAHNDYLSRDELLTALADVKGVDDNEVFDPLNLTYYNVSAMQSFNVAMDDENFRKYIAANKNMYVPGIASSFEAIAKNSSENITDARVVIQGDAGFTPGHVDLYCKSFDYENYAGYANLVYLLDIPKVESIIASQKVTVIGQTVIVHEADRLSDTRSYRFYAPEAYNTATYETLYRQKFAAVCGYLNNKVLRINQPFMPSMALTYMMQDLSNLEGTPTDWGFIPSEDVVKNFDKYKALPVLGLESVSNYAIANASPSKAIRLLNCVARFTYI